MKNVLVTGSNGLVGSALKSTQSPEANVFFANRMHGDLRKEEHVKRLFEMAEPTHVIHTAARVGGIGGNKSNHGSFFYDNILINAHVIEACRVYNVKKLLAFSSVCVFPDNLATLQEDKMHDGPAYESNFAYAYAKRMVDVQIQAYKSQYGIENYCSIIPGNIFGKHDMYDLQAGHVIPMLLHKLYLAKQNNTSFNIWGDGKSLREFLYVEDLAKILWKLIFVVENIPDRLIISGNKQYSIREVVDILVNISNFSSEVIWETNKPNGQRSRPTDQSKLHKILSNYNIEYTSLKDGLKQSWDWLTQNYPNVRQSYHNY